ncbi:MAG: hypothetical protein FJ276_23735 [Planctomycetes bacterium]|nr:hypothetical protein [Planctomycetota bacterium]
MIRLLLLMSAGAVAASEPASFDGEYFAGRGDVEYLELLDISGRMFAPDVEFQNLPMLYTPAWNGFVEGPTWGAWWIQNSYGPTYCALPFWDEPYTTFIQNSHDLWFNQMGDGQRKGARDWVAPDGCLCDAASPGWIYYKQGDGRVDIHDWGMEFTAAGVVMQAELLLIGREKAAIAKYLPLLERCANFIESRRDPKNNLFLAGPAGNLLAPSYAGYKKPDGTYDKAYLAGLSITYIAGLDRLIELQKMAGHADKVALYSERRELARQGLPALTTEEGYFVKYIDPDGTKHGVYGAEKHGYFEAVCNHDAICFRVTDEAHSMKIYDKIAAIPGLRPYDLIITNYPALDDMYEKQESIWKFGHWVNGGHWSTCEARMIMAYYRLGKYEDARRSMKKMLDYARRFRMDNPLIDFGNDVYQPHVPINCVYDNWGVPAAMIRGLFEYLYTADGLRIVPHIPPGITELHQRMPIRFGDKRLLLSTYGSGAVTAVRINGRAWSSFDEKSLTLRDADTPVSARIEIALGGAQFPDRALSQSFAERSTPESVDLSGLADEIRGNFLPVRIGASSTGGNAFVGEFRRARIHNKALTAAKIASLAADEAAAPSVDAGLVGDWTFDQLDAGSVANRAAGDLPARVVGEVQIVDTNRGKAAQMAGKGFLEIADDRRLTLDDAFTLEAVICPGELPDGGTRILDKCTVGAADGWTFDTFPRNGLRLITPSGVVSHDAQLKAGEWAHVAATFQSGGELTLYLNGDRIASAPAQPRPTAQLQRIRKFHDALHAAGMDRCYEARHAALVLDCAATVVQRRQMLAEGKLKPLPEPPRQLAADRSYAETVLKLGQGLQNVLNAYEQSDDAHKRRVFELWTTAE